MENSYNKIKNYFEFITEKHRSLKGFSGFSSRELLNKVGRKKSIDSPYLALFKYELGLEGPAQRTMAVRKLGFAVMFTKIDPDDFEAQYNAKDEAEKIALQVVARFRFDSNNKAHFLFNSFLKESVRILPVDLSANSFGVEVYMSLKNSQSLALNPEDWEDIDSVC